MTRTLAERLTALMEPVVTGLGYELVGLVVAGGRSDMHLRVYIDYEDGVTVDDCERVSHQLSALLDVEDPIDSHYTLEVSSPGIDRPLFKPEHYRRFLGRHVRLQTRLARAGRRRFQGVIDAVDGESVVLRDGDARWSLTFAEIEQGRIVPTEEDYRAALADQRL